MPTIEARAASITKAVGANLTALAAAKKQTAFSLHNSTGLPKSNIYRAFDGKAEPALHTLVVLAEALGTTVDALVRPGGPRGGRPQVARSTRTLKAAPGKPRVVRRKATA